MNRVIVRTMVGALAAAVLIGPVAANATQANPPIIGGGFKAVVVHEACAARGVMVNLSVITIAGKKSHTSTRTYKYQWDVQNDGRFETPLSTSPWTVWFYRGPTSGRSMTATVVRFDGTAKSGLSSVSFPLGCPTPTG